MGGISTVFTPPSHRSYAIKRRRQPEDVESLILEIILIILQKIIFNMF